MTKKEYEKKIFNPQHKKDYGPAWLKFPAAFGGFISIMIVFDAYVQEKSVLRVWRQEMYGKPIWALLYLFLIGCFLVRVYYDIRRYLDLDSEYKANMMSMNSSERKISNVTAAKNSVKPKFCSSYLVTNHGETATVNHAERNYKTVDVDIIIYRGENYEVKKNNIFNVYIYNISVV